MSELRVLQVIGAMNRAGAETVVMNLYRAMDRSRIQFDFLVHTSDACDYDAEIESLGGRIYRLPRYTVANGPVYRRACRRFFAEHPEFQVLHGHIGSCSPIYLEEAKKAGISTVVHSHRQNSSARVKAALYSWLVHPAVQYADEFLGCTYESGVDRFGSAVVGGSHFNIMNNAIDVASYACDEAGHKQAKEHLGFPDAPLLGNIGRLVPEKNQTFLLKVYTELLRLRPDAKLVVLGRGPLEDSLREEAKFLDLDPDAIFVGVKEGVAEYLKAIDVFVFPSLVEGFPMSLVEAQAAGAACIAADTMPASVVMAETSCQMSLETGPRAWAEKAGALLACPADRRIGAAGVRLHGFDIRDVAADMALRYERLALASARAQAGACEGMARGC